MCIFRESSSIPCKEMCRFANCRSNRTSSQTKAVTLWSNAKITTTLATVAMVFPNLGSRNRPAHKNRRSPLLPKRHFRKGIVNLPMLCRFHNRSSEMFMSHSVACSPTAFTSVASSPFAR